MSFGFSVRDLVATIQLCEKVRGEIFSAFSDTSLPPSRDIEALKPLIKSLDDLKDAITSTHSNKVLAQEGFQIPLRDGLAKIRRDVESLSQSMNNHASTGARQTTVNYASTRGGKSRKEINEAVHQLSLATAKLQNLLEEATYAKNQEVLSPIEALSIATNFEEANKIRQWLFGSENEDFHIALVRTPEEQTVSWILEDPAYQKWRNSGDSLLWLWGKRMPPFSQVLHID